MAEGWSRKTENIGNHSTLRDSSSSGEYFDPTEEKLNQSLSCFEYTSDEGATEARNSELACHGLASDVVKASKSINANIGAEAPNILNVRQVSDLPNTTAVTCQTDVSDTSDTSSLNGTPRRSDKSTHTMPSDVSKQRPSSYMNCPYHTKRDKYFIDHYCKDHSCLVCKKCARRRNHKKCEKTNVTSYKNVNDDKYQICPYHLSRNYFVDHFCKDHSCLVCKTCAKRKHAKCKTDSISNLCRDLKVTDEIQHLKDSIVRFKGKMAFLKETIDTDFFPDVQNEGQKILQEAHEMFKSATQDNERVIAHISADLKLTLEHQKRIIQNYILNIDDIISNLNSAYNKIESVESSFKDNSEQLFIEVHNLVPDVNKCVTDFNQLQSNLNRFHLRIRTPRRLFQMLSGIDKIGTVKVELKPYQTTSVHHFTFNCTSLNRL